MSTPTAPPDAPFEVSLVMSSLIETFERARSVGAPFHAMLLVADDPSAIVTVIMLPEYADDRAEVMWRVAEHWPLRPQRRILFATDGYAAMNDGDPRSPSDRPDATEALLLNYVEHVEPETISFRAAVFPYGYDDEGRFHWGERLGWAEKDGPLSPLQVAVVATVVSDEDLERWAQKN